MSPTPPDIGRDAAAVRVWDDTLHALRQPVSNAIVERLPKPPAGSVVLDLACGTGEPGLSVKARYPDVHLLGIDVNPAMVDQSRVTWTYVFPGTDAVVRFLAAPPFGSAIAGIGEAELAEVHGQVIAGLARFRRSDGSYHVPQECHLFWGRR